MTEWESTWNHLTAFVRETALFQSTKELLEWDERTMLPRDAGEYRAEQITLLAGLIHRRRTDPQLGEWIQGLAETPEASDPHSDLGATVRQLRRDYDRQTKVPPKLVEQLARVTVLGQQAWVRAREHGKYAEFQPFLADVVRLKREEADALGYVDSPYDALLDEYEPGACSREVLDVLAQVAKSLVPLIDAIVKSGRQAPRAILRRHYPQSQQQVLGTLAANEIGFDFSRGRLDVTPHPFCAAMGPNDCRITTRYDETFFSSAFFGILHEAGHGIYEQGLRTEHYGLPPGTYTSLGIHESQSRLWENLVGRSRAFWAHFFPKAQAMFPESLGAVPVDDFYFAINDVQPSFIRVEADEATYNLHIAIRAELEKALIEDELRVADLPAAWNEQYLNRLGIVPSNEQVGVLQDIHWSAGLFGYFPTYALGNLYAAQFGQQAEADLGALDPLFSRGQFLPLREWLQEKIHRWGQCFTASELIQKVTGRPLDHEPLMQYLQQKYGPLYGLH